MMIKFKIARFYAPDMHNEYLKRMCVVYYSRVVRFFSGRVKCPTHIRMPRCVIVLRHFKLFTEDIFLVVYPGVTLRSPPGCTLARLQRAGCMRTVIHYSIFTIFRCTTDFNNWAYLRKIPAEYLEFRKTVWDRLHLCDGRSAIWPCLF